MPVTILVGAQWGDEGKGKVADWLAEDAQLIARFNGGDNAGHTLNVAGVTYKLHCIPSGILREGVISLMGGGMVFHPARLLNEIETLRSQGVDVSPERLKIASNAHIITPAHQALEAAREAGRGADKIGTTGRGIGPTYASKAARDGLRASMMRDPQAFGAATTAFIEMMNQILIGAYGLEPLPSEAIGAEYARAAELLSPYLVDVVPYVNRALAAGVHVLAEGGQATLLDLDHGNYPYVTSSTATTGGALVGLGFGPKYIRRVVGVSKAFCTRVGSGPFPTEQNNEIGDLLRGDGSQAWDDFGTTTGRPRRCGWLDLVALRYAVLVNGLSELALMKLDVLSRFETLEVATAYMVDGVRVEDMPIDALQFAQAQPIYETMAGWSKDIMNVTHYADLPPEAWTYIELIEEYIGIPISLISVGPGREQTIRREA